MKYCVESKIYYNGKIRTEILSEKEAKERRDTGGYQEDYELYVVDFETLREAKAFALGVHLV